jgi:predicted enzyme related to lactoylglutathione lyase
MSEEEDCSESAEDKTPGIFSWRELISQDDEGSKKFYTELLGWSIESMDMGGGMNYNMFMQGERPVAGMIKSPKEDVPTAWVNYITVENLDATLEKAQGLGAHLCVPITEIPGKGRFACFIDPQGAPIAFWQFL